MSTNKSFLLLNRDNYLEIYVLENYDNWIGISEIVLKCAYINEDEDNSLNIRTDKN